ncbi:hypothetical protein CWO07_26870 [Vibrio splendidus]|uniref:Uncharacterized protein n=1 Tax=Vibrio splendidus TaxID=29497 RepID=A0A2T5DWG2_VIBSP|nr:MULTISPECIES: hypothetical protein [Vibrio]OED79807.1 hypothetical protein OAS_03420 [Vibrio cyclitrophicus ZF65]PMF25067.1 hypothetical protein BCV17_21410 [Vibrio cyclitrophicus]PMH73858.1 hypothetical protein BCU63_00585 [Vibrio splendidus]PMJ49765.1 hypothetical protein BCU23_03780 [Vibrio splendidus]PTP11419.1 hypothetical protein CWO07_26870 [Vibrio splendidus]
MINSALPTPYRDIDGSYAIVYLNGLSKLEILDDLLKNSLITLVSSSVSSQSVLLTIPSVIDVCDCATTKFDHFDLTLESVTALRETSYYAKTLITEDESILKLQKSLDSLGLEVLSMEQYFEKVNRQIKARDEDATLYSSLTKTALPDWVGKDTVEF